MSFIADLHVHSHLSRATSKQCNLEGLHRWAQLKGVRVVGTGDFTHPAWFSELTDKLVESAPGLYRLRPDVADSVDEEVPASCRAPVEFMLTGEISSIYKRDDRCRKVHSVIFCPDLKTAETINARLDALGNIKSDGRPILGLDPRVLLEITLEANPNAYLIPAHIWTPWFSMLGSKSGFDSPEECFGDLAKHIFAAETGLSSDPPMNWRVSSLDDLCLVSNSDLHSPSNLGRNANVFHCAPDFFVMRDALRNKDPKQFGGTIDLFPEEGKYHADGHRKCGVCMEPEESLAHDCLCPECGKPMVLGVLHRVVELAERPKGGKPDTAMPCRHIIPLAELLSEIYGCGPNTKKVRGAYDRLLNKLGPEFRILREIDPCALADEEPVLLAEAVRRLREENVIRKPGFDGEYGVIRVFAEDEQDTLKKQGVFFDAASLTGGKKAPARKRRSKAVKSSKKAVVKEPAAPFGGDGGPDAQDGSEGILAGLTDRQREAATAIEVPVIIVAGPGTGKTRTLTSRIAYLIDQKNVSPSSILAVTFTNRAANEMKQRLQRLLPGRMAGLTVATFHEFCLGVMRQFASEAGLPEDFRLADREEEVALLRSKSGMKAGEAKASVEAISEARRNLQDPSEVDGYRHLAGACAEACLVGLDELVPRCLKLLRADPAVCGQVGREWVCIDEYQDINKAQYELVRTLSPSGRGLCVIGDPDQAIYGFRGSDVSYFLRFTQDFPGARVFELSRNFRSSSTIVSASGQVIGPEKTRMSVAADSNEESGLHIRFHEAATAAAEAEFITHEIEKWLGGTALFSVDSGRVAGHADNPDVTFGDIAVLVRLRVLMKPLVEALTRLGLPVQVVGDRPFVELPGARQVIEGLRARASVTVSPSAEEAVRDLAGDNDALQSLDGDGRAALEQCGKLAAEFPGSLASFMDHVLLRQGADQYRVAAEQVTVMTLHAAKGLEFPIVFIAACEDGIVPYVRGREQPDPAEERRLLYVGMTRAQRVLYVTSAKKRTLFGEKAERRPSPFARDIENDLRESVKMPLRKQRPIALQNEFDFSA